MSVCMFGTCKYLVHESAVYQIDSAACFPPKLGQLPKIFKLRYKSGANMRPKGEEAAVLRVIIKILEVGDFYLWWFKIT